MWSRESNRRETFHRTATKSGNMRRDAFDYRAVTVKETVNDVKEAASIRTSLSNVRSSAQRRIQMKDEEQDSGFSAAPPLSTL